MKFMVERNVLFADDSFMILFAFESLLCSFVCGRAKSFQHLQFKGFGLFEIVCVLGLGLIVIIALLTIYCNRKTIQVKIGANETCFE